MRELSLDEVRLAARMLKESVPNLGEVIVFGSAAVSALNPGLDAALRCSVDVDMAPADIPVFVSDGRFVEERAGQDSEFYEREGFYIDYVPVELLRVTPAGWRERATRMELAPGLTSLILDAHDVAYNKLWAGRARDIAYVHALLEAGVVDLAALRKMHAANALAAEDRNSVDASLTRLAGVR
jgi:hypothetical protein